MKTLLAAILLATAAAVQANTIDYNYSMTVSFLIDSTSITNGQSVTHPPSEKRKFDTTGILNAIAEDEYYLGNYPSTAFPVGSRLVYHLDLNDDSNSAFWAVDANGSFLCDLSDVIWAESSGNPDVASGVENYAPGTLSKLKFSYIRRIVYDGTSAGDSVQFDLRGLASESLAESFNSKTGKYTQTRKIKFTGLIGSGTYVNGETGLISTATASASGSFTF